METSNSDITCFPATIIHVSGAETLFLELLVCRSRLANLLSCIDWYVLRHIPGNFNSVAPEQQWRTNVKWSTMLWPSVQNLPICKHSTKTSQDVCRPDEAVTVDAAVCPFRGGYVCTLEVYTGTHPAGADLNRSFSVIIRLWSLVKYRGHIIYMDRWFCSPKMFDHFGACGTKAVGNVIPNRKGMPKQAFSKKLLKWKVWHIGIISWP
jgi:hypothetical protein